MRLSCSVASGNTATCHTLEANIFSLPPLFRVLDAHHDAFDLRHITRGNTVIAMGKSSFKSHSKKSKKVKKNKSKKATKKEKRRTSTPSTMMPMFNPFMMMQGHQPQPPSSSSSSSTSTSSSSDDGSDSSTRLRRGASTIVKLPEKRLQQVVEAIDPHLDSTVTAEMSRGNICRIIWMTTRPKPTTKTAARNHTRTRLLRLIGFG